MNSMCRVHYTSPPPPQCFKHLPVGHEVRSPRVTRSKLFFRGARALPKRGKVFCSTTGIHMWLQFQHLEDLGIDGGAALSVS